MKREFIVFLILGVLASATLSSCGSTSFNASKQVSNNNGGGGGGNNNPPPPEPPVSFFPNLSYSFGVTGNAGTTPKWTSDVVPGVDTLLKVRVKALSNGYVNIPGYTNYSINPGCMEYRVGIKNASNPSAIPVSITTPILEAQNGASPACEQYAAQANIQLKTEYVYDFSAAIVGQAGPWVVEVSNPRYDYYCQLYPNTWIWIGYWWNQLGSIGSNCPLRNVYQNHLVEGSIEIQTNASPPG